MWWIILIIYILGYLGSLIFLGAVGEKDKASCFFWALLYPAFLLVLIVVVFFRSFYVLGKFFYDEQEDFCKYWCDHILDC